MRRLSISGTRLFGGTGGILGAVVGVELLLGLPWWASVVLEAFPPPLSWVGPARLLGLVGAAGAVCAVWGTYETLKGARVGAALLGVAALLLDLVGLASWRLDTLARDVLASSSATTVAMRESVLAAAGAPLPPWQEPAVLAALMCGAAAILALWATRNIVPRPRAPKA
jgi:hypothetical protein